jgi:hypothetical protein
MEFMKLPSGSWNPADQTDTVKSLFANEIIALDYCAVRNINNTSYRRMADGSATMNIGELMLDGPSF